MKRTPALFEKIEAYLTGQMQQLERDEFTKAMEEDESLAIEVEKHKTLEAAIEDKDINAFQKKLVAINEELKQKFVENSGNKPQRDQIPLLKVAAVIIILISAGIIFFQFIASRSNEDIYQAYFRPFPLESSLRGVEESRNLIRTKKAYKEEKFVEVIPALQILIKEFPDNYELRLYLASCYSKNEQIALAEELLLEIPPQSKYWEHAIWYQALFRLKMDDSASAKNLLDRIPPLQGVLVEEAQKLRNELD